MTHLSPWTLRATGISTLPWSHLIHFFSNSFAKLYFKYQTMTITLSVSLQKCRGQDPHSSSFPNLLPDQPFTEWTFLSLHFLFLHCTKTWFSSANDLICTSSFFQPGSGVADLPSAAGQFWFWREAAPSHCWYKAGNCRIYGFRVGAQGALLPSPAVSPCSISSVVQAVPFYHPCTDGEHWTRDKDVQGMTGTLGNTIKCTFCFYFRCCQHSWN